ncbi:exo-beta-N-acetylmuramidase NamZ domain-containing protein [Chitinimonas lacunae]|uniref:Exo-beta-N-acetylmuramidase NamZ domain-containing protein n=1 Tax=Chitinimonas lacunae TaxID=1963018 RepID=A0ABV8MN75_9NEIS
MIDGLRWLQAAMLGAFFLSVAALAAPPTAEQLRTWSAVPALVEREIWAGRLPGAVVLIGDSTGVRYRATIGHRRSAAVSEPLTPDTLFDLASLTKPLVTATAVLQLAEQGRLALDEPVARYWPSFAVHGKQAVTVRQLLAHTSGLRAGLPPQRRPRDRAAILQAVAAERLQTPPGQQVEYSDLNFIALGYLVERVSGLSLQRYGQERIFGPLAMLDTGFLPDVSKYLRIAPTEVNIGVVHDPTARAMGGVAGHAGLFGSADDLARFARMVLGGGQLDGRRILRRESVAAMTLPQIPLSQREWRGLGWRLEAPLLAGREQLPSVGAIGHTGFTGTGLWIDPVSDRFVVVLSHRHHPDGLGDVRPLRRQILALVASAAPWQRESVLAEQPWLTPFWDTLSQPVAFQTGIEVLAADGFKALVGRRIGLISNRSAVDAQGRLTLDLLRSAPGVELVAIFSPEHGFAADREGKIESGVDTARRLPIHSLYGATRRPTAEMLIGLDALVFDIQDVGARFYTYLSTLAYVLEAAAPRGLPVFVLDRPNPIRADRIEGPMLDHDLLSFTGYFPLPVRHGMTVGELARLFNGENRIGADLRVISMRGYQRDQWFDATGLPWVAPSPNLPTLAAATLYPGVALVEGANVSVGRGTDRPFGLLGAPWIDGDKLAHWLNGQALAGVSIEPAEFTPASGPYAGQRCQGIRLHLLDRDRFEMSRLGLYLTQGLYRLYPDRFRLDRTLGMIGSRAVLQGLRQGSDPDTLALDWQPALRAFEAMRARYLLY